MDLLRDQGQLWKVPAAGGSPVQITRNGGGTPAQSVDGRTIFYAKDGAGADMTRLWSVPAEGGEEREVLPAVFAHNFVVRTNGIYFIPGPEKPAIWFLQIRGSQNPPFWRLSGQLLPSAWMSRRTAASPSSPNMRIPARDIMMIENFR